MIGRVCGKAVSENRDSPKQSEENQLATHDVVRLVNSQYLSNTYVLIRGTKALVIDPADSYSGVIADLLRTSGAFELSILLTHEHFDHISGVTRLREEFSGTEVISSRPCSERIGNPRDNFSRYMVGSDLICAPSNLFVEDLRFRIDWAMSLLKVVPAPGHSPGSICILFEDLLFSGDTLIEDCSTVTRLPGGCLNELKESLARLRDHCKASTLVCPGHGDPFLFGSIDDDVVLGRRRSADRSAAFPAFG